MAVADIGKIRLIGLERDQSAIMALLHRVSALHLIDPTSEEGGIESDTASMGYEQAQIEFALGLLNNVVEEKKPLGERLLPVKPETNHKELERLSKTFDLKGTISSLEKLQEELNTQESIITQSRDEIEKLSAWQGVDQPLFDEERTARTTTIMGKLPNTAFVNLEEQLRKHKLSSLEVMARNDRETIFSLTTANAAKGDVEKVLSEFDIEQPQAGKENIVPQTRIAELQQRIPEAEKRIEKIIAKIQSFGDNKGDLEKLADWYRWKDEQASASEKSENTSKTFSLLGWIDKTHIPLLKKDLEKTVPTSHIEELDLEKDEKPPVALKNSGIIRPFESVTGIYGMPQPSEVDPTPFLAPFFIIFFALCLTDAGYGAVLAILSYVAMKMMKVPKENQKLFRLLIIGGIITFFIGALFGGWFGIVLQDLPDSWAWMRDPLLSIRVIDPVAEPITVLLLSFALGLIQVLVGLIIDVYWKVKSGEKLEAFLSSGLWFIFLSSIMFWTLVKAGVLPESLGSVAHWAVLGMVAVMVATQGRKAKNIAVKVFSGVMSLYNLIGYMSDILSYSRLLALGLATGIIASVVNLVASLFKGIPVVGWAIFIIALLGGHLFNLAINTLGAFIHSGRLQYVEFFPKFMEGGGKRFNPFSQKTKYVRLESNDEHKEQFVLKY